MVVETKILNKNPTIVYHRVSGRMSEDEAATGTAKAMSMIGNVVSEGSKFDLIMDMRGYIFDNLNAHRIWSVDLKEQKVLKDNVGRVAIIGDNSPKLRAEKGMMESDILKFFTDMEEAKKWLQNT